MCHGYDTQIAQQANQFERQMDLIERQNEWLLNMIEVYQERSEEAGNRLVERILTVTTTLQQQHCPVLDFLVDVRTAPLRSEPVPSLTLFP